MVELDILLIEDNGADVFLVREALEAHDVSYQLHVLSDGEAAIDYIQKIGISPEAPCPDILLLDLNVPKAEGADVLKVFRQHPECQDTPVIVVSSSDSPRDMRKVNALGVTDYFKKPSNLDAFLRLGALVRNAVQRTAERSDA